MLFENSVYISYSHIFHRFVNVRIVKQRSKSMFNRENRAYNLSRDHAYRICPEILNFCRKRLARRIDTVLRHPSHAILQHAFCLWQPLVRNDKHNVHEMDQQPSNISGNYVAFGVITQALRVFMFQFYKSCILLPILMVFSLCCGING